MKKQGLLALLEHPRSKFQNKFPAITQLHDVIMCSGEVVEIFEQNGESIARWQKQIARKH